MRGSILHATESMVNLKENEIKLLEQAEEATLRGLVKTEQSAPQHLLYLARAWYYTCKICNKTNKSYSS